MDEGGKKLPTMADLQAKPDHELRTFLDGAVALSTSSCSTARKDFECSDGTLAVTSHDGGEVCYTHTPPSAPPAVLPGEG